MIHIISNRIVLCRFISHDVTHMRHDQRRSIGRVSSMILRRKTGIAGVQLTTNRPACGKTHRLLSVMSEVSLREILVPPVLILAARIHEAHVSRKTLPKAPWFHCQQDLTIRIPKYGTHKLSFRMLIVSGCKHLKYFVEYDIASFIFYPNRLPSLERKASAI